MNPNYLDFEQPVAELEAKIEELRHMDTENVLDLHDEIQVLEGKCRSMLSIIFSKLSPVQVAQLARHPLRPYTRDYIKRFVTDFEELHGDRMFSDDPSLICGIGRIDGRPLVIIGHQKGRDTKEKIYRNFGMAKPEGYRKAMRIMKLAERFHLPIITMIDTPGAYPGVDAEERGQSEAIARNLFVMSELRVPVICTIIGEGGSGGALAIGVGDHTVMLQYSTYSVISPEGCASILWKSADRAADAAAAMGITSDRLKQLGLIDEIVDEPLGGAHRDIDFMAEQLKQTLISNIDRLNKVNLDQLLLERRRRLMSYGEYKETA